MEAARSMENTFRCFGDVPIYVDYHDNEWGRPVHDDNRLFELLTLEGMQAGLSWLTVLRKRDAFREAFDGFDPAIVAEYGDDKICELMANEGIIKNRLKILSAVNNAKLVLGIASKYGSFSNFIWGYVDYAPIVGHWESFSEMPVNTPLSDKISRDLKKMGFKFVGSTVIYSFMQATGIVNDHLKPCFVYEQLTNSPSRAGAQTFISQMEEAGFRAALIPYSKLISSIRKSALPGVTDPPPAPDSIDPQSVLAIAFPDTAGGLRLIYDGKEVVVPILPEFLNAFTRRRLKYELNRIAAMNGVRLEYARGISHKMLAVISGLGRYGYNTLCYVDGYGSYCSLDAYYTNICCDDADGDLCVQSLDTCASCGRCVKNCATGALERPYYVNDERCLYAINSGSEPMPDWLSPGVHHALLGCIRCQEKCPVNIAAPPPVSEALVLNEAESDELLNTPPENLSDELVQKLTDYGMSRHMISLAGRNALLVIEANRSCFRMPHRRPL
jgi:DNA-3-methyladenine glycosylase I